MPKQYNIHPYKPEINGFKKNKQQRYPISKGINTKKGKCGIIPYKYRINEATGISNSVIKVSILLKYIPL